MFNVLTKFGVTPVYCSEQCCEDCNWTRRKRYGRIFQDQWRSSPLSETVLRTALVLTSNEHSVKFRTMTNSDLCGILRFLSLFSLMRAKKMAANINVTERSTVYKLQYSYITAASKLYICTSYTTLKRDA